MLCRLMRTQSWMFQDHIYYNLCTGAFWIFGHVTCPAYNKRLDYNIDNIAHQLYITNYKRPAVQCPRYIAACCKYHCSYNLYSNIFATCTLPCSKFHWPMIIILIILIVYYMEISCIVSILLQFHALLEFCFSHLSRQVGQCLLL